MLVFLGSTPIWRPENSVNIFIYLSKFLQYNKSKSKQENTIGEEGRHSKARLPYEGCSP